MRAFLVGFTYILTVVVRVVYDLRGKSASSVTSLCKSGVKHLPDGFTLVDVIQESPSAVILTQDLQQRRFVLKNMRGYDLDEVHAVVRRLRRRRARHLVLPRRFDGSWAVFPFVSGDNNILPSPHNRHFLPYFKQLMEAVLDCDACGVTLFDLDPRNLIYEKKTKVLRVIDFLEPPGGFVHDTPFNSPPEGRYDHHWAVGAMYFTALTGKWVSPECLYANKPR